MKKNEESRYELLARGVDEIREMVRAVVAALVDDGFTDEQAREIVTAIYRVTEAQ